MPPCFRSTDRLCHARVYTCDRGSPASCPGNCPRTQPSQSLPHNPCVQLSGEGGLYCTMVMWRLQRHLYNSSFCPAGLVCTTAYLMRSTGPDSASQAGTVCTSSDIAQLLTCPSVDRSFAVCTTTTTLPSKPGGRVYINPCPVRRQPCVKLVCKGPALSVCTAVHSQVSPA